MVGETVERVIILRRGKIRSDGKVKDILTDKNLLEANFLELPLSLQSIPLSE
jgi:cobalt/nickel transport system ATP-binding protein